MKTKLATLLFFLTAGAQAQSIYTITGLGSLGAPSYTQAAAINNAGTVVGTSNNRAFSYTAGSMVDLGDLGSVAALAYGINSAGTVVGYGYTPGDDHAFSKPSGGAMVDLGTIGNVNGTGSGAYGINDAGTIVGWTATPSSSGELLPFSYTTADGMMALSTRGGRAIAINASGTITGYTNTLSGPQHVFSYTTGGGMIDLGTLGGTYSAGYAINAAGTIVGESSNAFGEYHPFLLTDGGIMVDLGTLGGTFGSANGINSAGTVVGTAATAEDTFSSAFVFTAGGTMIDLNTLVDLTGSGFTRLTAATGINDFGQIVGYGEMADLNTGAFLLTVTAIPEPSTYAMLAGLGALGLAAWRRRSTRGHEVRFG